MTLGVWGGNDFVLQFFEKEKKFLLDFMRVTVEKLY